MKPPIEGGTLRLRPTAETDLPYVLEAESAPENRPWVTVWPRARHLETLRDGGSAHLVAEGIADGAPVGYLILQGLRDPNGVLEFRRLVVTRKGRGHGREILRLVKRLAFERLGAHRLWLDVKPHNERARRLYASEGFVEEGTLRECLKGEAGYESLLLMSMLVHEYRPEGVRP